MKYCIPYSRNTKNDFKYLDEIDELEINYNAEDLTLPDFLALYSNKTIIINIEQKEDIDRIALLYEKYPNIKIKLSLSFMLNGEDADIVPKIKELHIPFFFEEPISSWDMFHGVLAQEPSDIHITGELGFELDKVAKYAHEKGIQIRATANLAQTDSFGLFKIPAIKTFFIRPEDMNIYAPYVDVIEFSGTIKEQSIFYDTYAHDKKWFGKLAELIFYFDSPADSRCFLSSFAEYRVKCGKRCLRGGSCQICDRVEQLAKDLEEQNLILKQPKEE